MKYYPLFLVVTGVFAQQSTTYTYDLNGGRVRDGMASERRAPGDVTKRQTVRNANGSRVPTEDVEERVISDNGRVRIVERIVRTYGPDGQQLPPERTRIEAERRGDGSTVTTTQTWRADLNRNYQLAERSVTETTQTAGAVTSSTLVERPSVNGPMEVWEKREELSRTPAPGALSQSTTVYHKDTNGHLYESARETLERSVQNGTTVENAATYQDGKFTGQTVTRSAKTDKGEDVEMDIFVTQAVGRAESASDTRPQLRERRLIERTFTPGGSVESVSVQIPNPNSGQLSAPRKIEETVCTGACKAPETPAAAESKSAENAAPAPASQP